MHCRILQTEYTTPQTVATHLFVTLWLTRVVVPVLQKHCSNSSFKLLKAVNKILLFHHAAKFLNTQLYHNITLLTASPTAEELDVRINRRQAM